eukprot:2844572-Pleurochrysis_carterae.AAC.1
MPGLTRAHLRTRTRMRCLGALRALLRGVQAEEWIGGWRRLKAKQQQSAALGEALLAMEATDVQQQVRRALAEGRLVSSCVRERGEGSEGSESPADGAERARRNGHLPRRNGQREAPQQVRARVRSGDGREGERACARGSTSRVNAQYAICIAELREREEKGTGRRRGTVSSFYAWAACVIRILSHSEAFCMNARAAESSSVMRRARSCLCCFG